MGTETTSELGSVRGSTSLEKPGERLPQPASANLGLCAYNHVFAGMWKKAICPYLTPTSELYLSYLINNICMAQLSILPFKYYQENGDRNKEI